MLKVDAHHLRARYSSGLLLFHLGRTAEALAHFRAVTEADPEDAYALYFTAQCLTQQGRFEEALGWYERTLAVDPYLRSAYYGHFQALQRVGHTDEARSMLETFQRLQGNPQARLAELSYTRMGPKALALAVDLSKAKQPEPPQGPVFTAPRPLLSGPGDLRWTPGNQRPSLTACDLNADGRLDLFAPGSLDPTSGIHNAVLLASPQTDAFSLAVTHPLAAVPGVNAAAWGDFDNDGLTDVYLFRRGPNQLWRQTDAGRWEDVTSASRTAGGAFNTVDGLFFDADHDGDLDIFLVNADGANQLLNNNLDGTFRPLTAGRGLEFADLPSHSVIGADLDGDRDVDIVVINRDPPHQVYLNDRLWEYHSADGFDEFTAAAISTATVADVDADGQPELYTLDPAGRIQRWQPNETGSWQAHTLTLAADSAHAMQSVGSQQIAVIDVTGNGMPEIIASTPQAWAVYRLVGNRAELLFEATTAAANRFLAWAPAVLDPATGPAIVGLAAKSGPMIWSAGTGRHKFAGLTDTGKTMRSNASGIGTRAAARIGSRWTVVDTLWKHSGPGQSLQPVSMGTGGAEHIDFVAIDWSDGVFQSELDLATGQHHHITETQRQLSSCPVLFAWNGTRFAFVSDILGVGGMGYAVGRGKYAQPRPWEKFLLPAGLLRLKNNRYQLKLTQPMEEVCYPDAVRLVADDLPPGWGIVLDERMSVAGPEPSGEPHFFRREVVPLQAHNDRGEDVTRLIISADLRAAPPGELDRRFIGRLRNEHVLTLTFPHPIDAVTGDAGTGDAAVGQPLLVIDGWVEYPYWQTMFAAWQAGADYDAPTIEARGANGRWITLHEQFGYPAGMPRQMVLPLGQVPSGSRELRIRTNQEIYWDRFAIVYSEPCPQAKQTVLGLPTAKLARVGFPHRTTAAQRVPSYDYARRLPFWDTRHPAGFYTAFGPVTKLLLGIDDALAIFGPGEEVHLEFAGPRGAPLSSEPPSGWSRHFVVEAFGWAKDMDLYTKDGETVGPLPTTGKPAEPRDRLHAHYHTRYETGH